MAPEAADAPGVRGGLPSDISQIISPIHSWLSNLGEGLARETESYRLGTAEGGKTWSGIFGVHIKKGLLLPHSVKSCIHNTGISNCGGMGFGLGTVAFLPFLQKGVGYCVIVERLCVG